LVSLHLEHTYHLEIGDERAVNAQDTSSAFRQLAVLD